MKSRLVLRRLSHIEASFIPVTGHSGVKYLPARLYSTGEVQNACADVGNTVDKASLATSLANLMKESLIYSIEMNGYGEEKTGSSSLAVDLASSIQESHDVGLRKLKPKTRLEVKRSLEMRVKKKVKEQYKEGKFHDILMKVIADATVLKDAYDCIRVTSNVDLASEGNKLCFQSLAEEIAEGNFNVKSSTYSISTRGSKALLLKISHGLRSGRGHWSALKYIRNEILNPDWYFTLVLSKKIDHNILNKLLSAIEEKINDEAFCNMLRQMFDARVLNLEFGGFAKGQGLPQEGILSPILMNIYLDLFDREVYRLSMNYEISDHHGDEDNGASSKLRGWFRRQINGISLPPVGKTSGVRLHCVRFMDEIFFAISGPREVALSLKLDTQRYLKDSLHLDVDDKSEVLACHNTSGVRFLGTLIKYRLKETLAVVSVHKLKDKVKMFAEQKEEIWNAGAARIAKKWLAHGLKKVKESEIKHLIDPNSVLHQISCYRKAGMRTDHWYKELLKIWMQDVSRKDMESEEIMLVKHVVEPALPQELTDSFYEFQKQARDYVASETASLLALLRSSGKPQEPVTRTEILAPVKVIMKRLHRYGLIYREGYARTCHILILLDDDQIIDWYAGIVNRWLRWYRRCDNFGEVKEIITNQVRMSCIRTLASKYRLHESFIEKKFDSELSRIPCAHDFELEDTSEQLVSQESTLDGALTYGINYGGLCLLSLARKVSESRPCYCFIVGCSSSTSCVYAIHVMERQRFPAWKTGFSSSIHPSLHRRRIGLCKQHVSDLFLGKISLQYVDFGSWR